MYNKISGLYGAVQLVEIGNAIQRVGIYLIIRGEILSMHVYDSDFGFNTNEFDSALRVETTSRCVQ